MRHFTWLQAADRQSENCAQIDRDGVVPSTTVDFFLNPNRTVCAQAKARKFPLIVSITAKISIQQSAFMKYPR